MTDAEKHDAPVLVAGGGPVGMILALELAFHGVRSIVVERNPSTTIWPKMDLTNGRSMELFRRLGIIDEARAVGVSEDQTLDIAYVTSASGHLLYRFDYGSPNEQRERARTANDGTMTQEPPMRVSQIVLEPVLKNAIDENPLVDVRFGWKIESLEQDESGVTSVIRNTATEEVETVRSQYLGGCDGGGSTVRNAVGIELEGEFGVFPVFSIHFKSTDLDVLAKFGAAYHLQTGGLGTMVAQDGKGIWTLHVIQEPGTDVDKLDTDQVLREFAGCDFDYETLVISRWTPHQVIAKKYREGRVFLAGDAAHQYIPTGGYGMNTGVWDAADLGWKLAAVINGWAGDALLDSVEERRKIGEQNRLAAFSNAQERIRIETFIRERLASVDPESDEAEDVRAEISEFIASAGNVENERWGIEHGFRYIDSNVIVYDQPESEAPGFDPLVVEPSGWPGARLPHYYLANGESLYDILGKELSLIALNGAETRVFEDAATETGTPLDIVAISDDQNLEALGYRYLIIRPDHHIAWSGKTLPESASEIFLTITGRR